LNCKIKKKNKKIPEYKRTQIHENHLLLILECIHNFIVHWHLLVGSNMQEGHYTRYGWHWGIDKQSNQNVRGNT